MRTRIVWDSGFGYEIGYLIGECEYMYDAWMVKLISGHIRWEGDARSKDEIKPWTKELEKELYKKYGYTLSFIPA